MSVSVPITLQFKATNLQAKDLLNPSDPELVVYTLTPKDSDAFGFKPTKGNFRSTEIFRTGQIKNTLNPEWEKVMTAEYKFEEEQWLCLQILDIDDKHSDDKHSDDIGDQDFLGTAITTVGRIINGQTDGWYGIPLLDQKQQPISVGSAMSMIYVKSTIMPKVSIDYFVKCSFTLNSTRFFKSNTPFFRLYGKNNKLLYWSRKGNGKVSEYNNFLIEGALAENTLWKFAHDSVGDEIGTARVTKEQLQIMTAGSSVQVKDAKGQHKGDLRFDEILRITIKEDIPDSIIHRISSGLQLSAIIAIDLTGSNGDPQKEHSLHYLRNNNQYKNAISSIIPIIDQYNGDKPYLVYGFGSSYDGKMVHHCKQYSADAKYTDGVIMEYENIIRDPSLTLSGPTHFAPIIRTASKIADETKDTYTVLVILTDGCINDMENTIDTIVAASYAPLSIIIVGIGNADFGSMNKLDNDTGLMLKDKNGVPAKRDIVQFVPIRECPNGATLRSMTLAELPKQILEFK